MDMTDLTLYLLPILAVVAVVGILMKLEAIAQERRGWTPLTMQQTVLSVLAAIVVGLVLRAFIDLPGWWNTVVTAVLLSLSRITAYEISRRKRATER